MSDASNYPGPDSPHAGCETGHVSSSVGSSVRSQELRARRHQRWALVSDVNWNDWRWQLKHRITTREELEQLIELEDDEREGIAARHDAFQMAITPYYASLMQGRDCPVRRQAVPTIAETWSSAQDLVDPLAEDEHSPVQCLSHRYPDRALLYVTHNCPVYCRHCTRQRKVGDAHSAPGQNELERAIAYIAEHPEITDVLVSGGDPLSLSDARLTNLVARIRAIPSVDIIRLCTRNPVTLPQRLTTELLQALTPYHPIYVNTHFNHPRECTPEAGLALTRLADAGFVVGNQSVLLRGINDDAECMTELNRWLLRHRCRPYYMFQCDPVAGTGHLRTPLAKGTEIIDQMRGRVSGLAIPHFAVDLPGGGGKVTLTPEREVARDEEGVTYRDHRGRRFTYCDPSPD